MHDDILLKTRCLRCKIGIEILLDSFDYEAWLSGVSLDKAMPYLDAYGRIMLTTNICIMCWQREFWETDK